ncbi:MAG: glycosyltransferase [Candidatus Shapirobacteria bacterium]|nr:glycosyltransferase [Candidatus Shapirobacteria bacterium]MDD3002471.1 glycosyltransferase [Candidatus Shapirobacteria bacterium]MDD4383340.1 glycosyltransferase [Candidatus Shapirobacteria bacterium]
MKNPIFSIIIPVRQTNPYLEETLLKLKKQSIKNFEVLVITDEISGSANPSEKRNLGTKTAKGDYLVFFDDDSFPSKNYFKNAFKLVKENPNFTAFCGPCLTPSKDNYKQKASGLVWSSWLGSGGAGIYRNSIQKARFVDDYPSVNLIVKKSDFNLAGGFDTSYWPGEDTVLCLNLVKKFHKKIFYHPSLIVYHHRRSVIIPHLQQITRYAIQRGFFAKKFPQTSRKIGYFIPSIFALYILFLIFFHHNFFFKLPLYFYISILITTFFYFIFQENKFKISFLATITIPITHIYYGILFLHGLFKKEVTFKPHAFDQKTGKYIGG